METTTLNRKKYGWLHGVALSLLTYTLVGCTPTPTHTTNTIQPSEGRSAMQPPVRVIISFQSPTSDNTQLSAAISEACHCQPIFLRPYLGNALIYEIALPPGHTFAAFEVELMRNAPKLGIKSVEQDIIMQHQ